MTTTVEPKTMTITEVMDAIDDLLSAFTVQLSTETAEQAEPAVAELTDWFGVLAGEFGLRRNVEDMRRAR